jgi:hypothetical protein
MRSNRGSKARVSKSRGKLVEILEARRLLSGAQLSYTDFSSTTGIASNGYGSSSTTLGTALLMTDGQFQEARSDIFTTKVPIHTFTANFSFQSNANQNSADGITFVIENDGTSALGAPGLDLGYSAGTFGSDSAAIALNLYNLGGFGSTIGFANSDANAVNPVSASPVDFHTGDTINAAVAYDGTTLSVTLTDTTTQATFSNSEVINLPQVVGGSTAYVGFTGATGDDTSTQSINDFSFSGASGPSVSVAAASSPTTVTGTKAHLSVTAVSNDGGTLSYAWTVTHVPSGAPTPTITPNNTASADLATAHFFKAGTYHFRVTVTDSNGGSTVSDLSIVVQQTPTTIKIAPHKPHIPKSGTDYGQGLRSVRSRAGNAADDHVLGAIRTRFH